MHSHILKLSMDPTRNGQLYGEWNYQCIVNTQVKVELAKITKFKIFSPFLDFLGNQTSSYGKRS